MTEQEFKKHLEKKRRESMSKKPRKERETIADKTSFGKDRTSDFGKSDFIELPTDTEDEYKDTEQKLLREKREGRLGNKDFALKIMEMQARRKKMKQAQRDY